MKISQCIALYFFSKSKLIMKVYVEIKYLAENFNIKNGTYTKYPIFEEFLKV